MKFYKIYLRNPFTMLIAGPTGSGKTELVKRLIQQSDTISEPKPERIIYFYGEYQNKFNELYNVELIRGLPDNVLMKIDNDKRTWIIIDDLMHESSSSKTVSELFTKGSHHRNVSMFLPLCKRE